MKVNNILRDGSALYIVYDLLEISFFLRKKGVVNIEGNPCFYAFKKNE